MTILMMLGPESLVFLVPITALCIPIVAIIASHRQKLAEMKFRAQQQADEKLAGELAALRREMTELRDTTTKYDLSFDSALQRMEARMAHVEQHVATAEQSSPASLSR